ncbi:hypothetical protein [Bacillus cereus]|uniref:hypothetical protein n=1 Tax=Bacillus cereus TaxID=1396 RepID=UPI00164350D6|nr:hypothetical protein [Bacillus cereus]
MRKLLTKLTEAITFKRIYFTMAILLLINALLTWDKSIEYTALSAILLKISRMEEN